MAVRSIPGLRGLPPGTFARRLWRAIEDHAVTDSASQLAYAFLFSLFPFLFFLVALTAYLPLRPAVDEGLSRLEQVMPPEAMGLLRARIDSLLGEQRPNVLGAGILFTLWTASRGVDALRRALNLAYDVKESRPFWRTQLGSIAVTLAASALIPAAFAMILLGGRAGSWLAAQIGIEQVFVFVWSWLRWPITSLVVMLAAAICFYFLPDVQQRWRYVTPGSVTSTVLWLLGTWGFTRYTESFGNYDATYGSIGAVVVLLTWLYLTALFIILGGEMNAVIEHAAPEGKAPGARTFEEPPPPPEERASAAPPGAAKSREVALHARSACPGPPDAKHPDR